MYLSDTFFYIEVFFFKGLPSGNLVDGLPLVLHTYAVEVCLLESFTWKYNLDPYDYWNKYFLCELSGMYFYRNQEHILRLWMLEVMLKIDQATCVFLVSQFYRTFHFSFEFSLQKCIRNHRTCMNCESFFL